MIRRGYVDTSLGQVHFRQREDGERHAVFLHQTASSSAMWQAVMERLPPGRLVAFDTPGFGGSDDPDRDDAPSMRQYAAWIVEAIDGCGIREFDLVGHHTGACIAVEIVDALAARVRSIAMIGAVPLTAEEREAFREHYSTPMAPTDDGAYLQETWEYLRGLGADSDLELHHRELLDTARAYYGRYQAYSAVWDQDFVAPFQRVQCPMLLMCARDDVLFDYFERAKEMRPDASHRLLEGANFEPDQDPDGTASALRDFWESL